MADRRPLVEKDGDVTEMPVGDKLPADVIPPISAVGLMPYRIEAGDQLVIESGFALISCGALEIIGGITLNGRICA